MNFPTRPELWEPARVTEGPSMRELGERARAASRQIAVASTAQKNEALLAAADRLLVHGDDVVAANAEDVARGLELGADAYLTKQTFDQRRLLETIGQLL